MEKFKSFLTLLLLMTAVSLLIQNTTSSSEIPSIYLFSNHSDSQTIGHSLELVPDSFGGKSSDNDSSSHLSGAKRHRRYITFNLDGAVNVGFLIVIPIIIIVPSMSNLFNKWRRRRSTDTDNELIESFQDSPAVQHHLNKIYTYFGLLEIPEKYCHERAICEFSAEPEKYYPISNMILRRLRDQSLPTYLSFDEENGKNSTGQSVFKVYNAAADYGQSYGTKACQQKFGFKCKYAVEKLLNMHVLKFWNGIANMLQLTFTDDDE